MVPRQDKHSDSMHDASERQQVSHRIEDNPLHAEIYHPRTPITYKFDASRRANGQEMRGMTAAEEKASIAQDGRITEKDWDDVVKVFDKYKQQEA